MEIPQELLDKCRELWDIDNTLSEELSNVRSQAIENNEHGMTAMNNHVRNWSREQLLDYHMGNVRQDFGVFSVAMDHGTSKIKILKFFLDQGTPSTLDVALRDLEEIRVVLETDDVKWWYINAQYDFWDRMTTEELMDI